MDSIFNEVCISVTAAFALTLVPGLRKPERSLLSRRDQGTAVLVFTIPAHIEEATVSHAGLLNEPIVAVCAAGLIGGPWVGLAVSMFVTWLAVVHQGLSWGSIAISMLCAGLVGGWLGIRFDFGRIVAPERPLLPVRLEAVKESTLLVSRQLEERLRQVTQKSAGLSIHGVSCSVNWGTPRRGVVAPGCRERQKWKCRKGCLDLTLNC